MAPSEACAVPLSVGAVTERVVAAVTAVSFASVVSVIPVSSSVRVSGCSDGAAASAVLALTRKTKLLPSPVMSFHFVPLVLY